MKQLQGPVDSLVLLRAHLILRIPVESVVCELKLSCIG